MCASYFVHNVLGPQWHIPVHAVILWSVQCTVHIHWFYMGY